mgnify:CR=1 FL=1
MERHKRLIGRRFDEPRGVRLRRALERLGPIFVKFGQVLSTQEFLIDIRAPGPEKRQCLGLRISACSLFSRHTCLSLKTRHR